MFIPKKISFIAAKVDVEIPSDDPDKPQRGSFVVHFPADVLDATKANEISQEMASGKMTDEDFIAKYVLKISGIGGATEWPEEEQRAWVLSSNHAKTRIALKFFETLGIARAKN